jgi:hypothetical protein
MLFGAAVISLRVFAQTPAEMESRKTLLEQFE